jgi:hypothetical protein
MRWIRFMERQEIWIRRLALVGVIGLLVVQILGPQAAGTFLMKAVPTVANEDQPNSAASDVQGSNNQSTLVSLELTDADLSSQRVTVKVNGTTEGQFTDSNLSLSVHQGDIVSIQTSGAASAIHVTVDHNDPNLFYPAPGYTISVDDNHPFTFDKVEFVQP